MTAVEAETITREEAKAAGLKRFFTGEPCKHGHVAERFVSSGGCVECQRAAGQSWYAENAEQERGRTRKWRARNPDQVRKAARRWRAKNPEQVRKYNRRWYAQNPEQVRERNRRWRAENPDRVREHSRRWYAKHAEQERERSRRWCAENSERKREYSRARCANDPSFRLARQLRGVLRAMLNGRFGEGTLRYVPEGRVEAVKAKIDADLKATPGAPASFDEMNGDEWHLDHVVPLSVMLDLLPDEARPVLAYVASHPDMLRPLPAAENIARGNRLDADAEAALPRFWEIVGEARAFHAPAPHLLDDPDDRRRRRK